MKIRKRRNEEDERNVERVEENEAEKNRRAA
jgi:hypothetical protein